MTKLKIRIFLRIRSYKTAPLHKPDHWWENLISDLSRECTDFTYVRKQYF